MPTTPGEHGYVENRPGIGGNPYRGQGAIRRKCNDYPQPGLPVPSTPGAVVR